MRTPASQAFTTTVSTQSELCSSVSERCLQWHLPHWSKSDASTCHRKPLPGHFCGESCANKWRGMLFGMTNRAGWNGHDPNDNAGAWRLWDDFGIEHADMYGWWNASCPVGTGVDAVMTTAFVQKGHATLIALASWSGMQETAILTVDWKLLGLDPETSELIAPRLPSFNRANETLTFPASSPKIVVPAYEGWLLILRTKEPSQFSI